MKKIGALMLAAGLAITGCGQDNALQSNMQDGPMPLGKPASKLANPRSVVMATLMQNGAPVSGATVAMSRSVAGRAADYRWMGTTNASGVASIEVLSDRGDVSGYYQIRATNTAGSVLGQWGSVPINGGVEQNVMLTVGGSAQVTMGASIVPKTVFTVRVENVSVAYPYIASGVFNTPEGASGPGPALPGGAYVFNFDAAPGSRLSFATMFVQSNDLFYAPDETGIALWNTNGTAISGDITSLIKLWDSGTEINQTPGTGPDQAPRQAGPNTGAVDPNNTVRLAETVGVPAVASVIRVTVSSVGTRFTVRIENVSGSSSLPTPFAPGVFVVHSDGAPLFNNGVADRGEGLEAIAEDGNPATLAGVLAGKTGVTGPLAPGVFAAHTGSDVLFLAGSADRGEGLEALAEDGSPAALAMAVAARAGVGASGAFAVPVGATGPGPVFPGSAYSFTFSATPGEKLSFATMFVQSNDWFYAPNGNGIALWTSVGTPISGDITNMIRLWDSGTEVNQVPGVGLDQAPRQSGANTGAVDSNNIVREVNDARIPAVDRVIRVTITPQG
ncbi:MAG: spondin domain-containing protein [Candidatus Latescibacterota bacterium]